MRNLSLDSAVTKLWGVLFGGAVWLIFGLISVLLTPLTQYSSGIDLVYLPAGIRLYIILITGVWGAIGIALANPILFILQLGNQSGFEVLINSLICGFGPLIAVNAVRKIWGIDANLIELRPLHLPILALAVSVVTPLFFNISFLAFNTKDAAHLLPNLSAMILGDFLGCIIVLVVIKTEIYIYRSRAKSNDSSK